MTNFIEECFLGAFVGIAGFPFFMFAWFCVLNVIDPD